MTSKLTRRARRSGRRMFLRGAAATVVSLPLMEFMLNDHGTALADGSTLPCRYLNFFCPTSLAPSGPTVPDGLTPERLGRGFDFNYCLEPLAMRGLEGDVSAISGMFAAPFDAPGGYESDYHGLGHKAVLTGVRSGWRGSENWRAFAPTAEHVIAGAFAGATRFDVLVYNIDPVGSRYSPSFAPTSSGEIDYFETQTSPAQAYRSLFTGFVPETPDPSIDLERRLRTSSLSYAADQIGVLSRELGAADRARLDEHLTRVRALEMQLASTTTSTTEFCMDPMHPSTDPPDLMANVPDHDSRSRLFGELVQLAFACDMTRSISVVGSNQFTGSGMFHQLWNHIGGLHGDVQHGASQQALDDANRWFVEQYASLIAGLKAIPEGTGSILDRTAAVFSMEGGRGGREADGGGDQNHSTDNMVFLLAGRSGGLVPGVHIHKPDEHPSKVFNTAMRAVGVNRDLGDIPGVFDELFSA
ncbi:MAG: DUF1552 domain-containing protein [Sandaracinaceae bacterium]